MDALTEIILISLAVIIGLCSVPFIGVIAAWYFFAKTGHKEKKVSSMEPESDEIWEENLGI